MEPASCSNFILFSALQRGVLSDVYMCSGKKQAGFVPVGISDFYFFPFYLQELACMFLWSIGRFSFAKVRTAISEFMLGQFCSFPLKLFNLC